MNERVLKLIPALITYVTERDSYVSKTKLLKLLYLFDIEWYRVHRETFTGFDWIFFHLGPWTREYDELLKNLSDNLMIRIKKSTNPSFDTEFLTAPKATEYTELFSSYKDEFILRRILQTWGERSTPEILDYTYFWTEPMKQAERYEPLDFSTIDQTAPETYVRERSSSTMDQIQAARARIVEAVKKGNIRSQSEF